MTIKQLCREIKDMNANGQSPMVRRYPNEILGPVYEAKPAGFGSGCVMVRINARDWLLVDPLMSTVSARQNLNH